MLPYTLRPQDITVFSTQLHVWMQVTCRSTQAKSVLIWAPCVLVINWGSWHVWLCRKSGHSSWLKSCTILQLPKLSLLPRLPKCGGSCCLMPQRQLMDVSTRNGDPYYRCMSIVEFVRSMLKTIFVATSCIPFPHDSPLPLREIGLFVAECFCTSIDWSWKCLELCFWH